MIGKAMLARHARRRDELPPPRWRKAMWLAVILACAGPVMVTIAVRTSHCICRLPSTPAGRTQLQLRRLAYEAFPAWGARHDDTRCPTIRELTEEVSDDPANVRDAWHQPIEIRCGDPLPNGAHGILLRSAGPDGMFGTEDDVTSADAGY